MQKKKRWINVRANNFTESEKTDYILKENISKSCIQ